MGKIVIKISKVVQIHKLCVRWSNCKQHNIFLLQISYSYSMYVQNENWLTVHKAMAKIKWCYFYDSWYITDSLVN